LESTWSRRATAWLPALVLLTALGVYTTTLGPTIDFWDCGEYVTTSHIVGVPHQPGTPLYVLVGRVFDVVFGQADITTASHRTAWAVNFMSAAFSALAVMLVYLIIVRVARRSDPDSGWLAPAGGLVGALFLLFSDTFWNNAIEAEVYGLAAFMMALLAWLGLVWYDHRTARRSDWLLLLLIYLCGLGVGFHLGSLLVYPAFFVMVWLATDRQLPVLDLTLVSVGLALFLASTTFVTDDQVLTTLLALYAAGCLLRAVWPRLTGAAPDGRRWHPFALYGLLLFLVGLSVHAILMIRAGAVPEPAINQTVPKDFSTLLEVLRREQYPPLNPLERRAPLSFQFGYYYDFLLRQWSFLPHPSQWLDRLSVLIGPILLALLGLAHTVRRARPVAWLLVLGYVINGEMLTGYLNFTSQEVRERDYFYFAAFLFGTVFVGLGAAALLRWTSGPLGRTRSQLEADATTPPPARGFTVASYLVRVGVAFGVALVIMALLPQEAKSTWAGLYMFGAIFLGMLVSRWLGSGRSDTARSWNDHTWAWRCGAGAALALTGSAMNGAPATENALLAAWSGPHGGVPPFGQVKVPDFLPALEASMAAYREEIRAITTDPEAPTFANTIAALEGAGRLHSRVRTVYGVWSSTLSTPEFQAVEREMEPRLAAFRDEIVQDAKLFARIAAVYESPDKTRWTPEERRLVWHLYTEFVRAGAALDATAKARVTAINQRLAALFTSFNQNLLSDEEELATVLTESTALAGLPEPVRAAAAAEAETQGLAGQWVIANTRSSVEPFLTYSERRDLREKVWRNFVSRGDHPGPHDNKPLVREILALRAERARLLGHETHAHWRLENAMARTPERAMELLEAVWTPAVARVKEEVSQMQELADTEGAGIRIEPWDYRYYAEKVRKARYDLDENELKPYLQLEQLREGMFWAAGQLFGLSFAAAPDVPVYHPDVRVWVLQDAAGGEVGLFYFDPFARPGKRSGAWMSSYRSQERFATVITPMVSNNCNFLKGAPGETVLISWTDAETLFHEFGHALHGLLSSVSYPSLSGTRVPRDYVELPSQLYERWLWTPELLQRFARHHQTGEPMPSALVQRIKAAATFNQGFATTEYLASGLIDMKLHLAGERPIDPAAFEREELAKLGMPSEIVMRHRLPQFSHLFASDGYSAGYYSYLWADTLTADAAEAFVEAGGFYDSRAADRFRKHVLAAGNTRDPAEAYREFRGRDAGIEALLRHRGFPVRLGSTHP